MRVMRPTEYRTMAWKNGGGSTTEIAVHPPGADLDAFDWRVSMADIRSDGPFSSFPGIDRDLALLSGNGLHLVVGGENQGLITTASPPLRFPGEAPVAATLADGPVMDLNVMSRRARQGHRMTRMMPRGRTVLPIHSPTVLLFCQNGEVSVETPDGDHTVGPNATLHAEKAPRGLWSIVDLAPAVIFCIELWPV